MKKLFGGENKRNERTKLKKQDKFKEKEREVKEIAAISKRLRCAWNMITV